MPHAPDADLSTAIDEVLADGSVVSITQLTQALLERGLDLGEEPETRVEESLVRREVRALEVLAEVHNLHLDEATAVGDFLAHYLHESEGATPLDPTEEWVRNLALFAPPAVAEAAVLELFAGWSESRVPPFDFLARVIAAAPRAARANLHWILGKARERVADTLAAEAAFESAQSLDADCWLALFDLARYASDRGQAERALTLLRRAGVRADDSHVTLLESFRVPDRSLGRNEACWCGSGRKFKSCHLGKEQLPLSHRAPWLFHKASVFLNQDDWQVQAHELASILTGAEATEEEVADEAWSPAVINALLFEDRALETFLNERGMLLPTDELAVARQWLATRRSVYLVLGSSDTRLRVRDLADDTEVEVWDPHAAQHLPPGFVLCARWLPVGEEYLGFGAYEPLNDHEAATFLTALTQVDNAADWLQFVADRRAEEQPV